MKDANSFETACLEYLLIAIREKDHSFPFRTVLDNWFAFREGGPFLNGNSRPHWFNNPCPDKHGQALSRAHFVSTAAARTLCGFARERLMKDHAVPVAVLRDMLFDGQLQSIDEVRAFLLRHYRFGIITEEQDSSLNRAGLRSRMPDGWTVNDSPFARYEKVGIVAQDKGRQSAPARVSSVETGRLIRKLSPFASLLSSTASRSPRKGGRNG